MKNTTYLSELEKALQRGVGTRPQPSPSSVAANWPWHKDAKTHTVADVLARSKIQPLAVTEDKLRRIELKWHFTNEAHIPKGVPFQRRNAKRLDESHAQFAFQVGKEANTVVGRFRRNRVDTGFPVMQDLPNVQIAAIRRGLANHDLVLSACYYYKHEKPNTMPKWVVVMKFQFERVNEKMREERLALLIARANAWKQLQARVGNQPTLDDEAELLVSQAELSKAQAEFNAAEEALRVQEEHFKGGTVELNPSTNEALRALATVNWKFVHVWKNPDATITVNCLHRDPQGRSKHAIVVRDGELTAIEIVSPVEENEE